MFSVQKNFGGWTMLQFLEVLTNENRMDFHNNFNCQNSLNKIKSVRKVNMIIITIAYLNIYTEINNDNKKENQLPVFIHEICIMLMNE